MAKNPVDRYADLLVRAGRIETQTETLVSEARNVTLSGSDRKLLTDFATMAWQVRKMLADRRYGR